MVSGIFGGLACATAAWLVGTATNRGAAAWWKVLVGALIGEIYSYYAMVDARGGCGGGPALVSR